tara:strand:- start:3132 stop:3773 length:642 start_codon:yes stop_codon:yes gene_type:complete
MAEETIVAEPVADATVDPNLIAKPAKETLMTSEGTKKAPAVEEKPAEDGDSVAAPEPAGAPENYEAFTLPDGFDLDDEMSTQFSEVAKELNLSQDQAQKLVDLQTAAATTAGIKSTEAWSDLKSTWQTEAKSDKEFGGKAFDENIGTAKLALEKYGSDELNSAIELTGMGNHPEFIRLLYKVGLTLKEDKLMVEGGGPVSPIERGKILFPDMN